MEMVLIREKFWGIVCQRRTKPESGAKAQTDFDEEAERAAATIFLYLSESAERYVRDLRDPVAIWAKLKEVFSVVGFAARYNLWKRLFVPGKYGGLGITEHLDRIREVGIQLKESGAEVSDELLVTAALQGLGEGFDTLVSVVTNGKQPTFDSLAMLLKEEASRRGLGTIGGPIQATALSVQHKTTCWHCGKLGHKRDDCFGLHPEKKGGNPSTGPLPTGRAGTEHKGPKEGAKRAQEMAW